MTQGSTDLISAVIQIIYQLNVMSSTKQYCHMGEKMPCQRSVLFGRLTGHACYMYKR